MPTNVVVRLSMLAQQGEIRFVEGGIDFALPQLCVTIELKDKQREAFKNST